MLSKTCNETKSLFIFPGSKASLQDGPDKHPLFLLFVRWTSTKSLQDGPDNQEQRWKSTKSSSFSVHTSGEQKSLMCDENK